jgi:DNA invertase Pin-like site-specific DNA recombinase
MSANKITALYCRTAQTDAERIAEQETELRQYAERHGYCECVCYRDNGVSGATLNRPGMKTLLSDIRAGRVNRVVVSGFARLARNSRHINELINLFDKCGIEFVAVRDGGVIDVTETKSLTNAMMAFALH